MPIRAIQGALLKFLQSESTGGFLLIIGALVAMGLANSPLGPAYAQLLHLPLGVTYGSLDLRLSLSHWINDGLMVIFFLLVGLEIKRELHHGELSSRKKLALPLAAAIGGMLAPAAIYLLTSAKDPAAIRGWAIPTATDIAFSLAVLRLLGNRVPLSLKVFLTALAIIDDLGAILVIALFYTATISGPALLSAACLLAILAGCNARGVNRLGVFLPIGVLLWLAVLSSGIHATIAGVLLAMMIPSGAPNDETSPLHRLESALHAPVTLLILPVFALANSGVSLATVSPAFLLEPIPLGIALGLLVGKPLGVFGAAWLCVRSGFGALPEGVKWGALGAVSLLTGIGFTMSLFIGALAFPDGSADAHVRIGVLLGSLLAAVSGFTLLRRHLQPSRAV